MMAGTAPLRSTSLNIVSVFLLDDPATWTFLAGSSRYTLFSSLNGRGDVGYGEQGAGLYLHGLGTYVLSSLLSAEDRTAGWAISGSGAKINDQRAVATLGATRDPVSRAACCSFRAWCAVTRPWPAPRAATTAT